MAINRSEQPELNFEEAMARLEQIVRALEGGNVPLDESLTRGEWRFLTAEEEATLRRSAGREV